MKSEKFVTLDVRQDIRHGREPFVRIMRAVAQLTPSQKLLLIAPFEPLPLLRIMAARGFTYTTNQTAPGRWEVLFEPSEESPAGTSTDAASAIAPPLEIDARGLEPPMPMVRILEAIETLPGESAVVAHTDRRPVFLLDELPRRGFAGQTTQTPDGSYITRIRRA